MKSLLKLSLLSVVFLMAVASTKAQTKDNIFDGASEITWLGLDFSQAKFIGDASNFGGAGEVTNESFRDKFTKGWNQLFIDEMKKYDVAAAVHRTAGRR